MKQRILLLLSFCILILSFSSTASAEPKKFNLGIGTYALTLTYAAPFIADDNFDGTAFTASYAISNNMAVRGNIFSAEHDVFSELDISGTDLLILFGSGFENEGLKAYLGAGIFNEDWEANGNSASFNGIQLNLGVGYSWDTVVVDLFFGIRDPNDYEALAGTDTAVFSTSLSVAARF